MEAMNLLHMHPTLDMIAEELSQQGISCQYQGERDDASRYRGVSIYQGGQPRPGILYLLPEGQEEAFPADTVPFISMGPHPGRAAHLAFPGQKKEAVLVAVLELFSRLRSWEMKLDELVYRNAAIQELCEVGAQMLGNPVCIHDDWFIMIAMSQELPKVMPPDYIMASSKEFVPRVILEDFNLDTDYLETYAHRSAQLWRSTPESVACLYVNLWDGDIYRGRLLTVEYHRRLRLLDYTVAEYLTQRAALLLQRQRLGEARSYRNMDDVMFSLLQGEKPDFADESRLMRMLSWSKTDKLVCICIQNQQTGPTLAMEHILHSDLFRAFPESYIMLEGRQQCVVLNLTRQPSTFPGIRHGLAPLCRDYCLYAGVSSPVRGIRELYLAYHQAQTALAQAFRLQTDQWILPFSACAMDYILNNLQTPLRPSQIAAPELQRLIEYDAEEGTQYFDTLRVYLQNERSIPRTSEALIIHRTTLLYRLKKIKALTELELNDPLQRLYLTLSLWLLEQDKTPKSDKGP